MTASRTILPPLFILMFVSFASLGAWQLRRAEEQRGILERFERHGELPALTTLELGQSEAQRYRRIEVEGRYLPTQQLLLDSMTHEGRAGYHVLTPFRPVDGARWLIVNRGWVGADPDRRVLPGIDVGEEPRVVRGRLDTLPRPGFRLTGSHEPGEWPRVVLFPTFDELEAYLGRDLFRYQVLLDAEVSDGFVRTWEPRVLPPERHVGYAIQWFSLAAVVFVLGIVLLLRSRSARR